MRSRTADVFVKGRD